VGLVFGVYLRVARDQGHNQPSRIIIELDDLDQTINEIDYTTLVAYQERERKIIKALSG